MEETLHQLWDASIPFVNSGIILPTTPGARQSCCNSGVLWVPRVMFQDRYPYKTVTDNLDAASNMSALVTFMVVLTTLVRFKAIKSYIGHWRWIINPSASDNFWISKLHPRKLTAGGSQNHGSENVFPFIYGDFWYLCQISGVYLPKFRRKMMELDGTCQICLTVKGLPQTLPPTHFPLLPGKHPIHVSVYMKFHLTCLFAKDIHRTHHETGCSHLLFFSSPKELN